MRPMILAAALAISASSAQAQTPQALLDQALLLGPAQLSEAGGQMAIFGQSGAAAYSADLSGPDCRMGGAGCTMVRFTSFAPPADQAAIDAWNGAGHGGTLSLDDGWLWLSTQAPVDTDPGAAFAAWGALLAQFAAQFDS